jgi:hypothetical protein
MPIFENGTNRPAASFASIAGMSLSDVVRKSRGSARLKRRVSSRFIFSKITIHQYVNDLDGVKEKLREVPIFGASSLAELDMVIANYLESELIIIDEVSTPYHLPHSLRDMTVGALIRDHVLTPSLSKLALSMPAIANYPLQKALDDPWSFHQALSLGRAIGRAKVRQIDEAILRFVDDVKAVCNGKEPSREYIVFGASDLMPPHNALEHCVDRLPWPQNVIVRDRYRFGKSVCERDETLATISGAHGVTRQKATVLIKQALVTLRKGPAARAAARLLNEPLAKVAQRAAAQSLPSPLKDTQIDLFLRDEPHMRLAVALAFQKPSDWITVSAPG